MGGYGWVRVCGTTLTLGASRLDLSREAGEVSGGPGRLEVEHSAAHSAVVFKERRDVIA
jgi:hypothetical protein